MLAVFLAWWTSEPQQFILDNVVTPRSPGWEEDEVLKNICHCCTGWLYKCFPECMARETMFPETMDGNALPWAALPTSGPHMYGQRT